MAAKRDLIMDDKKISRALNRIAHEIVEHNTGAESVAIIGIQTRGAYLARRIAKMIEQLEDIKPPVGLMDIGLYRDDLLEKRDQPIIQRTDILFSVVNRNVVLIDDVLYTGRTIRAALDQIIDFGRPRTIQLAVLVDRGHRELPIKADFVGVNIPTARKDRVVVQLTEKDGLDAVYLERGAEESDKKKPMKSARLAKKKGSGK